MANCRRIAVDDDDFDIPDAAIEIIASLLLDLDPSPPMSADREGPVSTLPTAHERMNP